MTAQADFLADRSRREVWLAELYPRDPATGDEVPYYFATDRYATGAGDTPASTQYQAQLAQPLNVALDAALPGTVAVLPWVRGGELRLGQVDGNLDELAALDWDGARCVVRVVGEYGRGLWLSHADSVVAFRGEVDGCLVGLAEAVVRLRDLSARWDDPLEARRYFGSDYMLHFASGSVVALGSPAKLNITGDLTVLARVRFSSLASINVLCSWWNSATAHPYTFATAAASLVYGNDVTGSVAGTVTTLTTDRWWSVAVTVTGSALVFYAWDEEAQHADAQREPVTLSSGVRNAGNGNFAIGAAAGATSSGMQLDELRVWSVVKTEAELDALRRRALTAEELADVTLKGCWRFEEGTGTTIADAATSPANGTASRCTWYPSLGGGEALAGQSRPALWGNAWNMAPAPVYPVTQIYECAAHRVYSVASVAEGGLSLGTVGTAYTDLLTFLAGTTTAGSWDSCITATGAWIRLGSNPSLPITWTGEGETDGVNRWRTVGQIVRRIVTTRGRDPLADPGDLDTASFTALDTAQPDVVGLWSAAGAERTLREALEALLGSAGAVAFATRGGGVLRVQRLEAPSGTPDWELDERQIVSLEPVPLELPVWEVELKWRPNHRPLSTSEMAGAIIGTASREALLSRPFRSNRYTDPAVLTRHPRARSLTVETLFYSSVVGLVAHGTLTGGAEGARLLALYGAERQAYRLTIPADIPADRFEVVRVSFRDLDGHGRQRARLGLGTGTDFRILGLTVSAADGVQTLTVWG